ncbi:BA75_01432T0 [Komagataella pastoris]|uniref:Xaa-Pro aminopeptidase n=1 Tax=Komagataella pastoris TaxID=4922 RepID=A0A1B2J776_PICPA|nr:BA75_01432T0 [Komagataella pastoris]
MSTHGVQAKLSTYSLRQVHTTPATAPVAGRAPRSCNNCTCSPGLLNRQGRMGSYYAKRMANRSKSVASGSASGVSRKTSSVLTVDSSCSEGLKEINTSRRLLELRKKMKDYDLAVYIVPSEDSHQSEYTGLADQRREFISGFTGSAGVAIITRNVQCMNDDPEGSSYLATDGRYFTQAANELDFNWNLFKLNIPGEISWEEFTVQLAVKMADESGFNIRIGVDPQLITYSEAHLLQGLVDDIASGEKKGLGVQFVPITENLIDSIWTKFEPRPVRPLMPITLLDEKYSGLDTREKLVQVKEALLSLNAQTVVVSALDDIAWLLNLRGSEFRYSPLFYAHLIIHDDLVFLFTDDHSRFESISEYLKERSIVLRPYDKFYDDIKSLSANTVLVTKDCSWEVARQVKSPHRVRVIDSPVAIIKAKKNEVELTNAREAHIKDAIALVKYYEWLWQEVGVKGELVDELEAAQKLEFFQSEQDNYVGQSFQTVSASGSNSAVVHYAPKKDACAVIDPSKVYLCDSGAQYLEGTTDVTRTYHFSNPTNEQKRNYTLVLKGHIALAKLKFPPGTTGIAIDAIARQHLWTNGLDYTHGTGHGVGSYLNVHEGPVAIGIRGTVPLEAGHLVTNEPGVYFPGDYGVRLENVMEVKETSDKFLELAPLTLVPFCRQLIDRKLLTKEEVDWVNQYHANVYQTLVPRLVRHSPHATWLKRATSSL